MTNKYDTAAQQEWLHEATDWETRRSDEFAPTVGFSLFVIFFVFVCYQVLNGMADWVSGVGA